MNAKLVEVEEAIEFIEELSRDEEERRFDNDNDEDICVLGVTYPASYILKEIDPIAYYQAVSDAQYEGDTKYRCPKCELEHDDDYDAKVCCQLDTDTYECGECGSIYDDLDEAEECCSKDEDDETEED